MTKYIFPIFILLLSSLTLNAQIDINVARAMSEGSEVTIEGIATNGSELGIIRYIQDATGAIPAYPGAGSVPNFPENVSRGDLVQITGALKIFNGLLEVDPITSYTVISSGNPLPAPLAVTPDGVNEENEAKLLRVENVIFDDGGGTFSVGNYAITENGGGASAEVRVNSGSPFVGTPIPQASVNVTGLSSEFNGNYQLLMRDEDDLEIVDDFYITVVPKQTGITTSTISIDWETNVASSSNLRYGTTPAMVNEITNSNSTTNHSVEITGLDATEFYYIQAFSSNGSTTVTSLPALYSTASNSTGEIRIYFNNEVDGSFSEGEFPTNVTGAAIEAAVINRINAATTSIDCSIYNINRTTIVEALSNAHNNGVIVRYVTDLGTANLALSDPTPPFPVVKGNTEGLMHNKFFVFDAASETDSWVIMGSTNMTANNIADDYNNLVVIQDQAIAKAYTLEFEEMWGANTPEPNYFNVKFGPAKTNNTPHLFNVNGRMVESYFSPSDNTGLAIVNAVETADTDLQFAMLSFTYNQLGSAVLTEHNSPTNVRGMMENINDQGSEFNFLQGNGVNILAHDIPLDLHHKYAIIDATNPASDPQVVTGSHNWSAGADTNSDENTLIFHDATMANIFLQEFEARWCEVNSGANCTTALEELNEIAGFEATLSPNPAADYTTINMSLETNSDMVISLWSINGQLLQSNILNEVQGERAETLMLDGMPSGMYFVSFQVGEQVSVRQLVVK